MLPITTKALVGFFSLMASTAWAAPKSVDLARPVGQLFSHKAHHDSFKEAGVSCTDCHTFGVKAVSLDALGSGVEKGFLRPNRKVCHECHLGKVSLPRPNQCTLCHTNTEKLMPESHRQNWKFRHGSFARLDADSCKECHAERTCTQCHTQRNTLKPDVHRPNFRLLHSIEARANPQSCVVCHSNTSFCLKCHTRGLK